MKKTHKITKQYSMNKTDWHYSDDTREVWIRQRRTALCREVGGAAAVWVLENTVDGVAKTYMHVSNQHEGIYHRLVCTIEIEVEEQEDARVVCLLKKVPETGTFRLNGKNWIRLRSNSNRTDTIWCRCEDDHTVCYLSGYNAVKVSPILKLLDV